MNAEKKIANQKFEADLVTIKNDTEKYESELAVYQSELHALKQKNNKYNVDIKAKYAQLDKYENQENRLIDDIKKNMSNYLDVRRYKKIKDELENLKFKQTATGSNAVLVRFIETDIFSPENENKSSINADYKNQVFFLTEDKKIEDIFNEALVYFEIEPKIHENLHNKLNYIESNINTLKTEKKEVHLLLNKFS